MRALNFRMGHWGTDRLSATVSCTGKAVVDAAKAIRIFDTSTRVRARDLLDGA